MENTLGWVQEDAVGLQLGQVGTEMLVVLLGERLKERMSSK